MGRSLEVSAKLHRIKSPKNRLNSPFALTSLVWLTPLILLAAPLGADNEYEGSRLIFLASKGELARSLKELRLAGEEVSSYDLTLLRQIGKAIVQLGSRSKSKEGQLLSLLGIEITGDPELMPALRSACSSLHPEVQLAALQLLAKFRTDASVELLLRAMSSPFIIIRLEAAFHLVQMQHADAFCAIQSLMCKVVPELHPLFPELLAQLNSLEADGELRRSLNQGGPAMQRSVVLAASHYSRDDLLPDIRKLLSRKDPLLLESAIAFVGTLRDSDSISALKRLARHPESSVRLAALKGLHRLGSKKAQVLIEQSALNENLYAINALGEIKGSEEPLASLLGSENLEVRINAAFALVQLGDGRGATLLREILISDAQDLGLKPETSPGGGLHALRLISCLKQQAKKDPSCTEISTRLREAILVRALEVEEEAFLQLAQEIFAAQQNDLIPLLSQLLESLGTEKAIALLESEHNHPGAPLIRNYCSLALFRLRREGPYREELSEWIVRQRPIADLQVRPSLPWNVMTGTERRFKLTPEENSRLMIDALEAIASCRDVAAITLLLQVMEVGPIENAYALGGLLMRIAE